MSPNQDSALSPVLSVSAETMTLATEGAAMPNASLKSAATSRSWDTQRPTAPGPLSATTMRTRSV